ncbi:MAG: biopolymer transporter ExbD [Bdellovibrionales bacterium]|nr:biopolymer transporter ExbD [Bdellovibrionales bacterium]
MKAQFDTKGKSRLVLSEINVTPFVDVMLVLLVIFMVTAPMLQQGIDLSLPEARSSGTPPPGDPFILKIKKNKKIYLGSQVVPLKTLSPKLAAIFKNKPHRGIYVQADKSLPYGFVARTLGEIKASGIIHINLVTTTK